MNVFSFNFLNTIFGSNGLVSGLGGEQSGMKGVLPFATLLNTTANENGIIKPQAGMKFSQENFKKLQDDLSSPDLLLSDLMAIDLSALVPGQTISLAGNWTLSIDNGDIMTITNSETGFSFPSFTKDQLEILMDAYRQYADAFKRDEALLIGRVNTQNDHEDQVAKKEAVTHNMQEKMQADAADERIKHVATFLKKIVGEPGVQETPQQTMNKASEAIRNSNVPASLQPLLVAAYDAQIIREQYLFAAPVPIAAVAAGQNNLSGQNSSLTGSGIILGQNKNGFSSDIKSPVTPVLFDGEHFDGNLFFSDLMFPPENDIAFQNVLRQNDIQMSKEGHYVGSTPLAPAQINMIVQRMAERGDMRALIAQLDPPELGRVQINLTSGSDKIIKAHILVEKPEALALLRRDLAQLEKALQNAGLSSDSENISLDLATDDGQGSGFFDQQTMREWIAEHQNGRGRINGTEVADSNNDKAISEPEEEFYQSDLAVNIKV